MLTFEKRIDEYSHDDIMVMMMITIMRPSHSPSSTLCGAHLSPDPGVTQTEAQHKMARNTKTQKFLEYKTQTGSEQTTQNGSQQKNDF